MGALILLQLMWRVAPPLVVELFREVVGFAVAAAVDAAAPLLPPRSMVHTSFAPFEFIVDLNHRLCSRLLLPASFAMATEDIGPSGFWLQVEGCPNGPSCALAERTAEGAMLMGQGWKSFSRARRLSRGNAWRSGTTEMRCSP